MQMTLLNYLFKNTLYLMIVIKLIIAIVTVKPPIEYKEATISLGGHKQQVHTLSVDMKDKRVTIENALSFGSIYGFEETSKMVENEGATMGVNGMFYNIYGHHVGLLVKGGRLITPSRKETPSVAILEDNRVYIGDIETKIHVKGTNTILPIATMNDAAYDNKWALYSRIYGSTTRIQRPSINYVIVEGQVREIIRTEDEGLEIPDEGYVLSYVGGQEEFLFQIGEAIRVDVSYSPTIGVIQEAFQSGGWLVRDGKVVAKDLEPYMGNTLIPNPRTLFGVTAEGKVIVKVIDGRQENSYGVSGREGAKLMLDAGCINAVYLDGGASSTMVVNNQVVNTPSGDEERKVAHSIIFRVKNGKK